MAQAIFSGALLVVLVSIAAAGLVVLVRRFLARESRQDDVDTIGFVFAVVGVLYAIVLAFVVIDVWAKMTATEEQVYREANALIEQYRYAETLPEPRRGEIQRLSRQYVEHVINEEWPRMQAHERPGIEGDAIADRLRQAVADSRPKAGSDELDQAVAEQIHASVVAEGQAMVQAREARLGAATSGVPSVVWFVLVGGAVLMIGLYYIFEVNGIATQMVLAIGLSVMTVLLLWSIYQMEYPFGRLFNVDSGAFEYALARFAQIRGG